MSTLDFLVSVAVAAGIVWALLAWCRFLVFPEIKQHESSPFEARRTRNQPAQMITATPKKYTATLTPRVRGNPSIWLDPCPFCGSDDLYVGWAHALGFGVSCVGCGARTRSFDLPEYSSKKNIPLRLVAKAAKAWNRRAL